MLHLITVGMKEKMSEKGILIILKKVCGEYSLPHLLRSDIIGRRILVRLGIFDASQTQFESVSNLKDSTCKAVHTQ